ncbi:MAG TPA: hypothetical protein VGR76_01815, partial [Candidatus Angelobacter sp.]|nr:hypothetical protein [Candidatus Angelobacter sp.]
MSELDTIRAALQKAGLRHRLTRALRGLWTGLLIGALLSLLVIGVYHVFPLPLKSLLVATICPFLGALTGFIIGGWNQPGASEVARWVDRQERFKERLSTALELSSESETSQWRDLILADAANHAKRIDAKRLLPFGLPKTSRWALVVLAVAAGLGFAPEYRSKSVLQKQADQANIKETGRLLADLTRRQMERRPPAFEPTQKALESVSSLGEELSKKALTRSDALKDLANVADKLKDQLKELGKDPGLKRLEEAARKNTGGNDSQSASSLQKQIDSLQKQLGTPTGTPDALDKLQKNLEKLQQAARGLADKNSSAADAERQKLSESLSELSKQIQGMGLQLPQLDDAINALAANQTDLFLKDLDAATTDLEKMKEMAKSLQQMQQQMEKLGKDLAEQLKNGQPEIAQQTLQKMITQLNSANLTPEQLEKILNEVSKAVDPAGNYGKVAEHLKTATGKMKGNDKPGAAQSLAAAAKELEDMMQQIGDAQELSATLDALNQASMCIGLGKCWGMCKGIPRAGKGGKPGRGVGTWADE